ncbi:MAG: porin [Gammaproteobacteria bacterium]
MQYLQKPLASAGLAASALMFVSSVQAVTDEEFKALQDQLNQLADAVENAPAAETKKVHIGGYGELHYNNWEFPDGSKFRELDFQRFVLFFGYDFTDSIRFHSEVEIEHAFVEDNNDGSGETAPGAIELEQAYVEFDLTENMETKGGLFLIPVGILNETHEPPTFYGVERNPIERNIIPTTWWEGGAALTGRFGASGLSYDLAITSGLDGGTNIRGGRQKVAKATANDLAYTGRLKYTGLPGLELAGTANYQSDMTQSADPTINDAVLLSAHAIYNISQFQVRALYASWNIDVTANASAEDQARDKQDGYYLEGSWKFVPAAGVFARYNVWDNGGLGDTEETQTNVGINYWPHEYVVLKFDVQKQDHGAAKSATEADGFNLGIGYQF